MATERELPPDIAQKIEQAYNPPAETPQAPASLFSSPQGFYGPGFLANLESRMRGGSQPTLSSLITGKTGGPTPQDIYSKRVPQLETAAGVAASLAAPNPATLLGRMGMQGGIQGGLTALGGHGPGEIAKQTGLGALFQGGTEALMYPAKLAANAVAARAAEGSYKAKKAFDEAFTKALNTLEQSGYAKQVQAVRDKYAETLRQARLAYKQGKQKIMGEYEGKVASQEKSTAAATAMHSERTAANLADEWKAMVPSWKDIPSTTEGLVDMVVGKGQQAVSDAFDVAMKAALAEAKGKTITVSREAAEKLGIKVPAVKPSTISPEAQKKMEALGFTPPQVGSVSVNAAEAIQQMTGKSSVRDAYREVANALSGAGLGNEAARAEYKAAQGLMDFVDSSGALVRQGGKDVLDAEKLMAARLRQSKIDELRNRGLGDALRGPLTQSVGQVPQPPPPIPKPQVPPFQEPPGRPTRTQPGVTQPPLRMTPETPPPDVTRMTNPFAGHPIAGGLAAEAVSKSLGLGHSIGMPFILGYAGSNALPKQVVTKAPLSPETQKMFQFMPGLLAALEQGAINQFGMKPQPSNAE